MLCPNCSKENPDDSNFCGYCGVHTTRELDDQKNISQEQDNKARNVNENTYLPEIFYSIGFIIFISGLVGGFQAGENQYTFLTKDRNWQLSCIIWVNTFLISMCFVGLGRIIDLLVKIYNK